MGQVEGTARYYTRVVPFSIGSDGNTHSVSFYQFSSSISNHQRLVRHQDHVSVNLFCLAAQRLLAFGVDHISIEGEIDGGRRLHVVVAEFTKALAHSRLLGLGFSESVPGELAGGASDFQPRDARFRPESFTRSGWP